MVFPSRKDVWMGIVVWTTIVFFLWVLYRSIFVQLDLLGIIAMVVLIYFLGMIWFNTCYKIENNNLKVSFGPFKKSIDIKEITSIRKTKNIFTAPSLSFNRIEIYYGKYGSIQISPIDLQAFISELRKENPNIQLNNKFNKYL
ncbi:hypothetical protein AN964_11730 [Heyndrickxia shackletonii]|uniref:Uncharacterized protein YyaB-like PH domain-containing protein n=1 Tax=Heyndrickxia shackletonii TaxID=157838 RepID=A0A0Q3WY88_9BACI|nr:PH domain-containing protein [Heyndrickxia shackletonii]KQL54099.1 hypothetical protein AN964_11730 [Heyndrickxia shackletonii]MBB2481801.1 PH domain-containing protein [Bacillus sp. APMAM]NEY99348.1 PH domain-containing protein [Heyndrickxia shackletonii]RTZ54819.1 hypothetical protein EKO25_15860 [Bacillus sp. SAJ1]